MLSKIYVNWWNSLVHAFLTKKKIQFYPAVEKPKTTPRYQRSRTFPTVFRRSKKMLERRNFISVCRRKSVCFSSFHKAKYFFVKKNAQNQRAKLIFSKWVKLLLYNFGLFQQVFENLKLNKLVKEERRLDLEDRIWRLKFGKTQFWSCILKNEFESLYFWKASFHFFGVW